MFCDKLSVELKSNNRFTFGHVQRPLIKHGEILPAHSVDHGDVTTSGSRKKLHFAVTDCGYRMVPLSEVPTDLLYADQVYKGAYSPWYDKVPVVDIYGVTPAVRQDASQTIEGANSVKLTVYGLRPHFAVSASDRALKGPGELCRIVKDRLQLLLNGIDPDSPDPAEVEKVSIYHESLRYLLPNEDHSKYDPSYEHTKTFKEFRPYVASVEPMRARTLYGFRSKDSLFLKIHLISPKDVPKARALFQGLNCRRFAKPQFGNIYKTFESNVEFVNRCTIDKNIKGMHWMEVDLKKGSTRASVDFKEMKLLPYPVILESGLEESINTELLFAPDKKSAVKVLQRFGLRESVSHCQIELDVGEDCIKGITKEPEFENLLPSTRVLSLDIEAANSVIGMFPSPTNPGDQVIIIGCLLYEFSKVKSPIEGSIFIIGDLDYPDKSFLDELSSKWNVPLEKLKIYCYDNEKMLLHAFKEYVVQADPDVLTGYNIFGFDMKYLCERAKFLGMTADEWDCFGKERRQAVYLRNCTFQSNAYGRKDFKIPIIPGRSMLDAQETVMRDYTCHFNSYKLDNVAKITLNAGKQDVPYWLITPYFRYGGYAKVKVAIYCLIDAILPPHILETKGHDSLYVSVARLCGVSLTDLVLRGQQKRGYCYLLSFLKEHSEKTGVQFLVPFNRIVKDEKCVMLEVEKDDSKKGRGKAQYSGATVIEPLRGYYNQPVATLDFQSLYPSLMLSHNICYSTLVPPHLARRYVEGIHKFSSPNGDSFISEHIFKGILPLMLMQLLSKRKEAKVLMSNATSDTEEAKYNSMQLALKLNANSLYGFTGAGVGKLPCFPVSRSVTGWGRHYIEKTKRFIQNLESVGDLEKYPPGPKTRVRRNHNKGKGKGNSYLPYLVIYGDTDSVMILFTNLGPNDMTEALRQAEIINSLCNEQCYPKGIILEMEKGYCPYLLLRKKGYVGGYWTTIKVRKIGTDMVENVAVLTKIDAKGLVSVRRDNSPLERELVKKVQNIIMGVANGMVKETVEGYEEVLRNDKTRPFKRVLTTEITHERAVEEVRATIQAMYDNDLPLSEYVITKALTRREEDYTNLQPHVKVNQDIRRRSPGSEYPLGARIPYIIAKSNKRTSTENAEDPDWMIENDIPPDISYYMDRLRKPLIQIFTPFLFPDKFMKASYKQFNAETPASDASKEAFLEFFGDVEEDGDANEDATQFDDVDGFMEGEDDPLLQAVYDNLRTSKVDARGNKRKADEMQNKKKESTKNLALDAFGHIRQASQRMQHSEKTIIQKAEQILFSGYKRQSESGGIVRQKILQERKNASRKHNPLRAKSAFTANPAKSGLLDFIAVKKSFREECQAIVEEEEAVRSYMDYRRKLETEAEAAAKSSSYEGMNIEERIYEELLRDPLLSKFAKEKQMIKRLQDVKPGAARCFAYAFGSAMEEWIDNNKNALKSTEIVNKNYTRKFVWKTGREDEDVDIL